ncbi:cysteine proteinase [Decorospora gaudefroyi]|uniref:Cysteine proteinase n=1 Tax=Decorospora gaudefroyi TaxID=184978 RepID=A0A6A5K107_9PLEO|nr:cysteine proteinase [Decorospora gaudefroyi]
MAPVLRSRAGRGTSAGSRFQKRKNACIRPVPSGWPASSLDTSYDSGNLVLELDSALFNAGLVTPWNLQQNTQECPGEFTTHFHAALEDATNTNTNSWQDQADAMFKLNTKSEHECSLCGLQSRVTNNPYSILQLPITEDQNATDSLYAALRRYFTGTIVKNCATCGGNTSHRCVTKINAGPQVLTIQLLLFWTAFDRNAEEGEQYQAQKTMNRLIYPMDLDLSPYQPDSVRQTLDNDNFDWKDVEGEPAYMANTPLKYKLQAVTSHGGAGLDSGHYIATVRNPNKPIIKTTSPSTYDSNVSVPNWILSPGLRLTFANTLTQPGATQVVPQWKPSVPRSLRARQASARCQPLGDVWVYVHSTPPFVLFVVAETSLRRVDTLSIRHGIGSFDMTNSGLSGGVGTGGWGLADLGPITELSLSPSELTWDQAVRTRTSPHEKVPWTVGSLSLFRAKPQHSWN